MATASEIAKQSLGSLKRGLKGLERSVEELEKLVLRSLETGEAWLSHARADYPSRIKTALTRISNRVFAPLLFARKEDLRAVIARLEELEARLDGTFRETAASKKPRVAAKA